MGIGNCGDLEARKEARADDQAFINISRKESLWCWHKDIERDALAWAGVTSRDLIVKIKVNFFHTMLL